MDLIRKPLLYLFEKTKLGRLLNDNKRILGFMLWLLGYVAQGLGVAATVFPEVGVLGQARDALLMTYESVSEMLKTLGLSLMAVGVYHAAEKEKK